MMLYSIYNKTNLGGYKDITIKFISVLLEALLVSILIWILLWDKNKDLIHSIFGITSVCIGVATFLIVWNKRGDENNVNHILGLGFLVVSIFDFMHTYYYDGLVVNDILKSQLSIGFSLLARLIEVTILMIFSIAPYIKNINRNIMIIGTIIITSSFFCIIYVYPNWASRLYDAYGITIIKVVLECSVIIIAVLVLLKLNSNLQREQFIKFKYLYMCILLMIPSEACLTFYKDLGSFWVVFGHVLKVFSYFYLYKAVFQSLINYAYDKLSENNQRLVDILNAIPISIHTYNNDNEIDFVNKKFEELFKCPKENILGLKDTDVLNMLHKIGNESEDILTVRVKNNEENTRNIIRTYSKPDGNEMNVLINANKINGGVLVLASDVKQEQEVKNLNLQAQTILNSVTEPAMLIDDECKISACNKLYANLIEMDHDDIIGMDIYKLYDVLNLSSNEHGNLFKNGEFKNEVIEWSIETSKGKKKQLQITTSVITNIYNENIGVVFAARDISKVKEEQLKLINQEKLALLGQMGATIVHETRNFLTTIKGNSQLIELYVDNEKIRKYARKINSDTNEVNRIISDFLSLSKPRETELEEVAFNDLLSSMKNTIETSSLMKQVELILDLDYDERYIYCDETQIRQVILNICKNAIEAMESVLSPVLHISTGLDEYRKEVFIEISDNGEGMDNQTIKKIGTPFFTTKKTGTGLGLNACYEIIKEHKGRIDIKSELGKGTAFKIIIPYIDDDLEDM